MRRRTTDWILLALLALGLIGAGYAIAGTSGSGGKTEIATIRPTGVGLPRVGMHGTVGAGDIASPLAAYHDSGHYESDLETVGGRAQAYLDRRVPKIRSKARKRCRTQGINPCPKPQLALVLDIDETSLSNYQSLAATNFAGATAALTTSLFAATSPAIDPTLQLFEDARDQNVSVFFITGRPDLDIVRQKTEENLTSAGYSKLDGARPAPERRDRHAVLQVRRPCRHRGRGLPDRAQRRRSGQRPQGRLRGQGVQAAEPVLLHQRLTAQGGGAQTESTENSFHSPGTPFSEWEPRSANSIPEPTTRSRHGRGREDLAGIAESADPGADVDGHPTDVGADHLDLTGVEAGAEPDAEVVDALAELGCAADGAGRAVERGEEAVPGALDRDAAVGADELAGDPVVILEQARASRGRRARRRSPSSRRCR